MLPSAPGAIKRHGQIIKYTNERLVGYSLKNKIFLFNAPTGAFEFGSEILCSQSPRSRHLLKKPDLARKNQSLSDLNRFVRLFDANTCVKVVQRTRSALQALTWSKVDPRRAPFRWPSHRYGHLLFGGIECLQKGGVHCRPFEGSWFGDLLSFCSSVRRSSSTCFMRSLRNLLPREIGCGRGTSSARALRPKSA